MTREEAIRILASSCIPGSKQTEALETLIPELRESEDERIRKGLVKLLTVAGEAYVVNSTGIKKDSYLAYLKKLKDKAFIPDELVENYKRFCEQGGRDVAAFINAVNWQKEQKPAEWSEEELAKRHLEGYIMGREDTMREMKDFIESHFNTNKAREGEDLTDLYRKEYAQPFPIMPTPPSGWGCDGTHCTNPQMDCINCPRKTTGGGFNTSSGTSTATLHGNTSATDGKEHNPSFTD